MPYSVLQSNWYYGTVFAKAEIEKLVNDYPEEAQITETYVRTYDKLDAAGYDQIPTASNWASNENFAKTVPLIYAFVFIK